VDNLLTLLQDTDDNTRLQATLALGAIGPGAKAAVPQLAANLRDDKVVGIRANAAAALGRIRVNAAVAVPALLHAALNDPEPDVRGWAMNGLGAFGPEAKSAIPALREAAQDPKLGEDQRRQQAVAQLADRLEGKVPANSGRRSGPSPQQ
jgi:HEAT repeat protein